jgi:hypothetical protein
LTPLIWHFVPLKPETQAQVKLPSPLVHYETGMRRRRKETKQKKSYRATILARIGSAFVDIGQAASAYPAIDTLANKRVDTINTSCPVAARIRSAFVDIGLTQSTRITDAARARE